MEERIIDDEMGRGVRLKKTKDGYVDVTDAQMDTDAEEIMQDEEEIAFEFPTAEEELDEDFIGLPPEEVEKRRIQRAEEEKKLREEYLGICAQGKDLLEQEDYENAAKVYNKALKSKVKSWEAPVGFWKAKTENFTKPEILMDEYAESGVDSLEYDLSSEGVQKLREEYKEVFSAKYTELSEKEKPLEERVLAKQASRRSYLKERLANSLIWFAVASLPFLAGVVLTIVFGLKNFSTPDDRYILPTIFLGVMSLILFVFFLLTAKKLINAKRIYGKNEKIETTEDGQRLVEIGVYKELYEFFLTETAEENPIEEVEAE